MSDRPAVSLRQRHFRVRVEAADSAHLIWLVEFLRPWFELCEGPDWDRRVILDVAPQLYRARLARSGGGGTERATCFVLDKDSMTGAMWVEDATTRVVRDDHHDVFYQIGAASAPIRIVAERVHGNARVALMRVVRELAAIASTRDALLHLHAAAFALDGAGIAIGGAKGAGKTTTLCHALQIPGARFIANDRLLLYDSEAGVEGAGFPTIVRLRGDAIVLFPGLTSRLKRYHHSATMAEADRDPRPSREALAGVSPAQFCAAAGVAPEVGAELRAVLFPVITDPGDVIRIRRLPEAESARRLAAGLFHATAPAEVAAVWPIGPAPGWMACDLVERCRELSRRVPGYACEMGPLRRRNPEIVGALEELSRRPHRFD
jgi:hypothetical protein